MTAEDAAASKPKFIEFVHHRLLRVKEAGLADAPVEDPSKLLASSGLTRLAAEFKSLRSASELENHQQDFDEQLEFVKQLKVALSVSTRDLTKNIQARARESAKKTLSAKQKEEEKARKRQLETTMAEKKKVLKMKDAAVFALATSPEEAVPQVSLREVTASAGAVLCKPCVIKGCKEVSDVMVPPAADGDAAEAIAENTLQAAVSRWHGSFHKHTLCLRDDRVSAPLYDAHGKPIADEALAAILKNIPHHGCEELPSVSRSLQQPWLFGYSPNLVLFSTEPDYLATIRVLTLGQLQLMAASPGDIAKASGKTGLSQMLHWMRSMSASDLKKVRDCGGKVFWGLASAGDIIFMPAGFLVACTPANNAPVAGVRRSLLPDNSDCAEAQLARFCAIGDALKADNGGKAEDPGPCYEITCH